MNKKTSITHYNKFIFLIVFILQFSVGFSQRSNNDSEDHNVFENDDIVVYGNPETETLQIIAIKRITDNTFPNHIVINGNDYPIYTISPIEYHVEWPEERPDTLIIPEGIRHIGRNFTATTHKNSPIPSSIYPNLRCLKLPSTLESIGDEAFYGNVFENLIIPPSVVSIGREAFTSCKIKNLDLGKVQVIGSGAFPDCGGWVIIPEETRIIGRGAFDSYFYVLTNMNKSRFGYPRDSELFFLQLSPVDINPVVEFIPTFGSSKVPYVACASEFLRPDIMAKYQSDMPEVFNKRAMIHLEESPVPLYFSFEETGDREWLWEPGIDLWARTGKRRQSKRRLNKQNPEKHFRTIYPELTPYPKKALDIYSTTEYTPAENNQSDKEEGPKEPETEAGSKRLYYPVRFRIDASSLPEKKRKKLRVFYNDEDITDSVSDNTFTISHGKTFDSEEYKSGGCPIYNRIKITMEE